MSFHCAVYEFLGKLDTFFCRKYCFCKCTSIDLRKKLASQRYRKTIQDNVDAVPNFYLCTTDTVVISPTACLKNSTMATSLSKRSQYTRLVRHNRSIWLHLRVVKPSSIDVLLFWLRQERRSAKLIFRFALCCSTHLRRR